MVNKRFMVWGVVLAVFSLAAALPVRAAVIDWNVAGPADWDTAGNWNPAQVPELTDTAMLTNGGTAQITGALTIPHIADLEINNGSTLSMTGGSLNVANSFETATGGTAANINIDGAGTTLSVGLVDPVLGHSGLLTMNITNGGIFEADVSGKMNDVGQAVGGSGVITVQNSGSQFLADAIEIGDAGSGTITVSDGGLARFDSISDGAYLGRQSGSNGQLNINGTVGSRGVVEAHYFEGGGGTHKIDFDGGIFRALGTQNALFRSFDPGEVTLNAGGGFFDTNGFYVETDAVIDGAGGLTKQGANFLVLTGNNTYDGVTRVDNGTLRISSGGDITQTSNILVASDGVNNATLNIRGMGSTVTTTGLLEVGADTGTGTLDIEDSGVVNSIVGRLATITTAMGNATVTGSGSQWNITNALTVGSNGDATLDIENGGRVSNSDAIVARFGTSTSSVTVTGIGSEWINTNSLTLGFDGDATLTVAAGGVVNVQNGSGIINLADAAGSSGTVNIGSGGAAGFLNAASVNGNTGTSTLNFNHTDSNYFFTTDGTSGGSDVLITGNTAVTHSGSGTTILTADNNYTGTTTISGGTLRIGNGGNTGSLGTGDVTNNGLLRFNLDKGAIDLTIANNFSGTGDIEVDNGGVSSNFSFTGTNDSDGGFTVENGRVVFEGDGHFTYSGDTTVDAGAQLTASGLGSGDQLSSNSAHTINGILRIVTGDSVIGSLAGSGQVDILGGASLAAGIDNSSTTFSGTINQPGDFIKQGTGTLTLTGNNTYLGTTTISGGTLRISSNDNLGNASAAIIGQGGTLNTTADITMNRFTTLIGSGITFEVDAGTTLTQQGVIDDVSGTPGITKTGDGTLVLTANNDFPGATTIDVGTLQLGDGGTTGNIIGGPTPTSGVSIASGANFAFNRSDTVDFSVAISGDGTVTQDGTGTLELSVANTYTGGTTHNSGRLNIGNNTALGTGDLTINDGILSNDNADRTLANNVIANNSFSVLSQAGTTIQVQDVNVASPGITITGSESGTFDINGVLSGTHGVSFATVGPALTTFELTGSAANTMTGTTTVNDETELILAKDDNIAAIADDLTLVDFSAVGIGSDEQIADSAIVTLGPNAQLGMADTVTETIGDLQGSGTINLVDAGTGAQLILNSGDFSGSISGGNATQTSLTKATAGTLTLSGASTFAGLTDVQAGTLRVTNTTGSATGSSAVTVQSGATLGGTGTIGGTTTIQDGGILAPGTSPGTITFNSDLILNNASILDYELDDPAGTPGVDSDLTVVNANLTLDGILNITDLGGFGVGTYRLFDYTGSLTDNTLDLGTVPTGLFTLAIDTSTANQINLNVTSLSEIFWDGANTAPNGTIDGGNGFWDAAMTNWTNATGTANGAWFDDVDAIFAGSAGTVTIVTGFNPTPSAIDFQTSGYTITAAGTGGLDITADTDVNIDAGTATIDVPIAGIGGLTKTGAGELRLGGDNTYTGDTNLNAGTLAYASDDAFGDGTLNIAGGTTLANAGGDRIMDNAISVDGNFTHDTNDITSSTQFTGPVDLGNATRQIGFTGDGDTSFSGAITESGGTAGLTLTNVGASELDVFFDGSTSNSYTGSTTVDGDINLWLQKTGGATAIAGNLNILPNGVVNVDLNEQIADTAQVQIDTGGELYLANGVTETILQLAGAGTVELEAFAPGAQLIVGQGIFSGDITGGNAATTALVKNTNGTLTLSGDSDYEGGTEVQDGTLLVSNTTGSATGVDEMVIRSGAALGGTGTITGDVTLENGATLIPGLSPGTLTVGNLTLDDTTQLDYEFGPIGGNDLTMVTGDLTLDGILNVSDSGGFGLGNYTIFDYTGSLTDNELVFGTMPGFFNYEVDTATTGEVSLVVSALTEIYWDGPNTTPNGSIDGGDGIWSMAGTNWTNANGNFNDAWISGGNAVFAGNAGTVTIDNAFTAEVGNLTFETSGYLIEADTGGALEFLSDSQIDVVSGIAMITAPITGSVDIEKTGAGLLLYSGDASTFSGEFFVNEGEWAVTDGQLSAQAVVVSEEVGDDGLLTINANGQVDSDLVIVGEAGVGELQVINGGYQSSTDYVIGDLTDSVGTVSVDGLDSEIDVDFLLDVGLEGMGTLDITNGGYVETDFANIGTSATGAGFVNVTDSGSELFVVDELVIAHSGTGTLNIHDGGFVDAGTADIGMTIGSFGTVDIDGPGSTLEMQDDGLDVGFAGFGVLTVAIDALLDQSSTISDAPIDVGVLGTAFGTINIGAASGDPATGAGILDVSAIDGGDGTAILVLNHTDSDYHLSRDGTAAGDAIDLTGSLEVVHDAGTTTLGGNSTYTGGTTLNDGTLIAASDTAFGTGDLTINGGTMANDMADRDLDNDLVVNSDFNVDSQPFYFFSVNDVDYGNATHTVTGVNTGEFDIDGIVSGTAGVNYANASSGNANFDYLGSDPNTLTGTTTVGDGVILKLVKDDNMTAIADDLLIQSGGSVGITMDEQIDDNATVTVNNGGQIDIAFDVVETIGDLQGSGHIDLLAAGPGAQLIVNSGNFAGNITGGNASQTSLTKESPGLLVLSGHNPFLGTVAINDGALSVNDNNNLGDAANELSFDGGTLLVTDSFTTDRATTLNAGGGSFFVEADKILTHQADITGPGTLTTDGPGTVELSGNNSHAATIVNGERLTALSANALGNGPVTINGEALEFDAPGSPTFANDLDFTSGSRTLTVEQDTTLSGTISNNAGNTLLRNGNGELTITSVNILDFTGVFSNALGDTVVDGVLGGSFVNNANLRGTGAVGDLFNNGVLEPGNSIGQFSVLGNLAHESGAVLDIEYNPFDADFPSNPGTSHDVVEVAGSATLEGGSWIQVIPTTDGFVQSGVQMVIIDTDLGATDNGTEVISTSLFIDWIGEIVGDDFVLTAFRESFTTQATNANQRGVATGLDELAASPLDPTSESAQLINTLSLLAPDQFRQALDQLSPQRYDVANIQNRRNIQSSVNALTHYLASRRFGLPVQAQANTSGLDMMFASDQNNHYLMMLADESGNADAVRDRITQEGYLPGTKLNLWAQGFYLNSNVDSETDSVGYSANTGGGMVGMDFPVLENLLVGISFTFTGTHADFDNPGGDMDIYTYRIGPYLSWEPIERLFVDFSVSYAFSTIDSSRTTTSGMSTVNADASYNGHDISVYLGAEYDVIPEKQWYVAPLIGLNYIWFHQQAFTETGAGPSNLSVDAQNTNSLDLRVGGRFAWMGQVSPSIVVVPEAVVAYRRELLADSNDAIAARFVNATGGFDVPRGPAEENGIEVGAGVSVLIDDQWSVFARYTGTFYNNAQNHFATVGLRFGFK